MIWIGIDPGINTGGVVVRRDTGLLCPPVKRGGHLDMHRSWKDWTTMCEAFGQVRNLIREIGGEVSVQCEAAFIRAKGDVVLNALGVEDVLQSIGRWRGLSDVPDVTWNPPAPWTVWARALSGIPQPSHKKCDSALERRFLAEADECGVEKPETWKEHEQDAWHLVSYRIGLFVAGADTRRDKTTSRPRRRSRRSDNWR